MNVTAERLLAFAASHENEEWETRDRHKRFRLKTTPEGFEFTPGSSGIPRRVRKRECAALCERFDTSGSRRPKDYLDLSRNSSYVLAIIAGYLSGEKPRSG